MAMMEVGFLGTGRMGKAMAVNLLKAGHRVRAWDKSHEPLDELERAGADIAANAADAVRGTRSFRCCRTMPPCAKFSSPATC